ncbi:MAG: hypothetical protein ACYC0N_01120 [Carboxydocellales bacterium]
MSFIKKHAEILTIILCVTLTIFYLFYIPSHLYLVFLDIDQKISDTPSGEITPNNIVGQSFVSNEDNLSRIEVLLATYARLNSKKVIFHLKESPESPKDIATVEIMASRVNDNQYQRFDFPLIKNSKGKTYYFYFESPESISGDAITVWSTKNNVFQEVNMYINHKSVSGTLAFRTYYLQPKT